MVTGFLRETGCTNGLVGPLFAGKYLMFKCLNVREGEPGSADDSNFRVLKLSYCPWECSTAFVRVGAGVTTLKGDGDLSYRF